ncbi:HET-domain-containing protein [Microthyrium microscopicum]|uniref:HET-domain-containing protein n=1 Tax=Microthyrium microscopicum TaxID=703497 RepID=A0A6A6U7Z3_9PEZI|nr:HET-domain-containing protein [Microthyrium microscopicum]
MEPSESHKQIGRVIGSGCQHLSLNQYLIEDKDPGPTELGGFQEISQRTNCSFCQLIISALSAHPPGYWEERVYPFEQCHLGRTWDVSGAPRLVTWFDATSSTLPSGITGHSTTFGEILLLKGSSDQRQDVRAGLARVVGESRVDFSLISGWIHSCEEHHRSLCNPGSYKPTYIRLLDIKRMCLVSGSQRCRYFALSYVWGSTATFETLKSNLSELGEDRSILQVRERLPRSINDAISLVSALQERFLWVDALCIVQDDAEDKQTQISHMDIIYRQAVATIVSLSGQDANAGLPGVQEGSRQVQQRSIVVNSWRLFAKLPELSAVLQKSKWQTRAWTFQEGILSRRCLFFSNDQVYFQCQSGYFTEDTHGDQTRPGWGLGFTNPFRQRVTTKEEDHPCLAFNTYNNLVKAYSNRQHTYNSDSLNAFRGVLSAFNTSFGWRFISALPEDVFDLALLWRPMSVARLRPRGSSQSSCDVACTTPTWCWTSWIGNIYWDSWRTVSYAGKAVSLEPAVEQFCIASLDGFHGICRRKGSTGSDSFENIINDAKNCLDISWNNAGTETKSPWIMVLFFKASVTGLSKLSILSEFERREKYQNMSDWLRCNSRGDAWICDSNGWHCGTLYGLPSTWKNSHNPRLCELVLLSTFSQEEVTPADINAHRLSLPLDYPSSDDYYNEIFDTSHYKYTDCWAHNIILVEWNGNLAMRVAVGQIHVDAWVTLETSTKMIPLV